MDGVDVVRGLNPEKKPRRGLVLGGGGLLGIAWMTATLDAYEKATGWDARDAEVLVGTSAGSILSGFLACGIATKDLMSHQLGEPTPDLGDIDLDYDTAGGGSLPPRPSFIPGSRGLLWNVARHPRKVPPLVAAMALLPAGKGSLVEVRGVIDAVNPHPDGWAPHPNTWIVTMDYDLGRRVVFGKGSAPVTPLSSAVVASCSIPAWFEPVTINGRRYVDGGTCSPTSLDLLASRGLDEVIVLAPMCSYEFDQPDSVIEKLERRVRKQWTRRLTKEAMKVRASGTRVTLITPGPEDLEAIGFNVMDPKRRRNVLATAQRTAQARFSTLGDVDESEQSAVG